jgi:hypothetical protein
VIDDDHIANEVVPAGVVNVTDGRPPIRVEFTDLPFAFSGQLNRFVVSADLAGVSSASNTLRSREPLVRLRACRVIDICTGVVVVLLGIALACVATWIGIVALLGGLGL